MQSCGLGKRKPLFGVTLFDLDVKVFVYLDVEGIDLLYSQTVERVEVSRTEQRSGSVAGKAGLSARLKSVFLLFLGQGSLEGAAEASVSRESTLSITKSMSVSSKLRSLIESLESIEHGVCFSSLAAAAKYSTENKQKVFFCGSHRFDAPQFFEGSGPRIVTDSGYLILQSGQIARHIESDDYYKETNVKADMACSISKMPRSQNGMAFLGHDATYLRAYKGIAIPFMVFSAVIPLPGSPQVE